MMKLVSSLVSKSNKAAKLYNKVTSSKGDAPDPDAPAFVLGREVGGHDGSLQRRVASTPWLTYRRGFPPLVPASHTSDVGWGCMLRVGQMALGQTVLRMFLGPDWTLPPSAVEALLADDSSGSEGASSPAPSALLQAPPERPPLPDMYYEILRWFADTPDPSVPYSIHNISSLGCRLGVNIGDWFAPTTIGNCLQYLVNVHAPGGLAMYVAYDATVYLADLESAATAPVGTLNPMADAMWVVSPTSPVASEGVPDLPHLYTYGKDPGGIVHAHTAPPSSVPPRQRERTGSEQGSAPSDPGDAASASSSTSSLPPSPPSVSETPALDVPEWAAHLLSPSAETATAWRPTLVFVPVRLGLQALNDVYIEPIKAVFEFPQTIGVLGGKPRGALFFIGVQGDSLVYLDPHSVQPVSFVSPDTPPSAFSYQCSNPRVVPVSKIDPSMAFCFYCASPADVVDLIVRLNDVQARFGTGVLSIVPGQSPSSSMAVVDAASSSASSAPPPSSDLASWEDDDFEFI